jgi:glycosyltransferase A (GT-A) superfamily protein (DUF2064 family)
MSDAAQIGDDAAARLYTAFLEDCWDSIADAGLAAHFAITPESDPAWFRRWKGAPVLIQRGPDLGMRIASAFRFAWQEGRDRPVVYGSDSPTVPVAARAAAQRALVESPVVIAPDHSGGYYAIGVVAGTPLEWLDGIAWGSQQVLEQTRAALAAADLPHVETTPWLDVDLPSDLDALRADLAAGRGYPAPSTRAVLATL